MLPPVAHQRHGLAGHVIGADHVDLDDPDEGLLDVIARLGSGVISSSPALLIRTSSAAETRRCCA